MKKIITAITLLLFIVLLNRCSSHTVVVSSYFDSWPQKASPLEIGKLVADRFIASPHPNFSRTTPATHITYPEVCTWFGALLFSHNSGDKELLKKLIQRFEPLFNEEANLVPVPDHVDYTVFGSVPLELYIQTKDGRYLEMGLEIADKQWGPPEGPRVNEDSYKYYDRGLTWQTRMWIDDMFMITAVQSQAFRATGDKKYIDQAANEMVVYLDSLQRSNGLFYHAPDVPFFWGRGNGWMAAGMTLILKNLPTDNPNYTRILEGYKKMMTTLLKYQDADGMWNQLIDKKEAWQELSGSAMFTFAFISGVKSGWLNEDAFGAAARKGWLAITKFIDVNGNTREVCEGTNKKNDEQYYLDRNRRVGDMHGQAPVLWCASALLEK